MDLLAARPRSARPDEADYHRIQDESEEDPALRLVPTPFPLGMRDALTQDAQRLSRSSRQESSRTPPMDVPAHAPPEYAHDSPVYSDGISVPPPYDEATLAAIRTSAELDRQSNSEKAPLPLPYSSSGSTRSHLPPLSDEKKQIELDRLTSAIDRAQRVAPQLEDQRAEASGSRVRRTSGGLRSAAGKNGEQEGEEGKGKERASTEAKEEELVEIWNRIERAHGNRLRDQTYEVDVARQASKDRQREESFYTDLVEQSSVGRMHDQDHPLPVEATSGASLE